VNNFVTRALTGAVFITVLGGAILWSPVSFMFLFGLIALLGINEFYRLFGATEYKPNVYTGSLLGIVFYLITCGYVSESLPFSAYLLVIPFVSAVFIAELYSKHTKPFQNIGLTLLGAAYVVIPFSLLVLNGFSLPSEALYNYNPTIILGFFFLLWTSDTGAYLVGITLGKHPLFPRISPKKSWEGFIGGIVLTLVVAIVISKFFTVLSLIDWVIIGVIIAIFGVLGDLIESLLKRSLQIKDSGNILPGHGGILDRFDSVIFSAPLVFLYIQIKLILLGFS
jgi:phosphatidate cytidylyltransferase